MGAVEQQQGGGSNRRSSHGSNCSSFQFNSFVVAVLNVCGPSDLSDVIGAFYGNAECI